MSFATILVDRDPPSGIITLNRPERYNALTVQLMGEVVEALDQFEQDQEIRGVIITGTDKFFSTGADLNEASTVVNPADAMVFHRKWRALGYKIEQLSKPVVAAISGYAITGGCEMSMACDIRIAAENAQFAITSVKIGSLAGFGGTQRLPRIVGPSRAKMLLYTADFIDVAEAYRIGLVDKVVPVGKVVPAAKELISVIAQRAPLSVAWTKMAVNTGMNTDLESALTLEGALMSEAFATADKLEGMRAFLEKRTAVFQGR